VQAKRQEILQKAGLYEGAELGDEIAATEEKMEKIKELLKNIAKDNPAVRQQIQQGLYEIFNEVVGVPVSGEVVVHQDV
jgi:septal ring factor EnvC (AmiA/AmiB activator)